MSIMTTPSIMFALTAAALLSTASCQNAQVKEEAKDVEEAQEDVKEAQEEVKKEEQKLEQEKAEFSEDLKQRVAKAEERYAALGLRADKLTAGATDTMAQKDIEAAKQKAMAEIEDVRNATPTTVEHELEELDEAMDKYDELLNKYGEGGM